MFIVKKVGRVAFYDKLMLATTSGMILSPVASVRAHVSWSLYLAAAISFASCGRASTAPTPAVDPPVVTCPIAQSVTAVNDVATAVTYGGATVVGGRSPLTTTCVPASGSVFEVGSTSVTCTATDADRRVSSCVFTVSVTLAPRLNVTRFAAFGDSITWGEDGTFAVTTTALQELIPRKRVQLVGHEYPTDLLASLRARYTTQAGTLAVLNAGNPGERVGDPDTLTRFSTSVLSGGYQALLLMEGANDLYDEYYGSAEAEGLALANLRTIVERAKGAGLAVFLATIPPEDPFKCVPICRGMASALVAPFNTRLRALAAAEGVALVDVNQAFGGDGSLLSTDGLHPNASGYQRIADTFFQAIVSTQQRTR